MVTFTSLRGHRCDAENIICKMQHQEILGVPSVSVLHFIMVLCETGRLGRRTGMMKGKLGLLLEPGSFPLRLDRLEGTGRSFSWCGLLSAGNSVCLISLSTFILQASVSLGGGELCLDAYPIAQ